jgi:hypothetical protein
VATDPFRFTPEARAALRQLWNESVAARAERVACLAVERQGRITVITRVELLSVARADSAVVAAGESIHRCGPPDWLGTVHTHIARFGGQPYVTFSRNDRHVMFLWRRRWGIEGVFCLLYSERAAHCEAEPGVSGEPSYNAPPDPG